MKKDLEQKRRDKDLEAIISQCEYNLWRAQAQPENAPVSDDGQSDPGTKDAMAITPVASSAPSMSATPDPPTSPLGEEQTHTMEVDDGNEHPAPASLVSPREDELLTGNTVVGVEGEMANLTVSSPKEGEGSDKGASI